MYTMEDLRETEKKITALLQLRSEIIKEMETTASQKSREAVPEFMKGFAAVEKLEITKDTVVAYQGVPGAYSHQAMFRFFGKEIKNINVPSFREVIQAVKEGRADYGVLPIENSSAGFVNGIYDMLGENDITIVGEEEEKVSHVLIGTPDASLSDVRIVYSHPQGLLQCKNYIESMGFEQHSVANTAVAAVKVMEEQDKTHAAVASALAAEIYGLKILKKGITDNENNTTRFIILSKRKIYVKSSQNVSICFSLPHESGTLYHIMSHINLNGINMTSIESRPLPGRKWEYAFYVVMDGSLMDPATINALRGIEKDSINFRLLGTY